MNQLLRFWMFAYSQTIDQSLSCIHNPTLYLVGHFKMSAHIERKTCKFTVCTSRICEGHYSYLPKHNKRRLIFFLLNNNNIIMLTIVFKPMFRVLGFVPIWVAKSEIISCWQNRSKLAKAWIWNTVEKWGSTGSWALFIRTSAIPCTASNWFLITLAWS